MSYECELLEQGPQPIVSIKTRTPVQDLPKVLGSKLEKLGDHFEKSAVAPAGPPFVAYYNMDMQDLEIEIGFPVQHPIAGDGEVKPGEIAAGRFAACLHVGPYYDLKSAYDALAAWVTEQGLQPSGVSYEYYLNDPNETAPENLQTRIVFPIV